MTKLQRTTRVGLVLLGAAYAGPSRAEDASRDLALQINAASGLLREGDVDGAIAAYQRAQASKPPLPDLTYNLAVAQYRKGDVTAAAELFRKAAVADDDAVAARARFNLGNCDYVSALEQADKNRQAAIQQLQSAIGNYRSALDIDSSDADARANIELAAQLIDRLRQQQEQQQDQQQESDQSQDQQQDQSSDQQSSQGDQQQDQQQPNQAQSDQENQGSPDEQDANNQQQDNEQSQSDQSSDQSSDAQQQDQQQASQSEQPDDSADKDPSTINRDERSSTESPEDESSPPQADEANEEQGQEAPKGQLSAAQQTEQDDAQNQRNAAALDQAIEGELTREEAQKMLQAIRDRDMIRRLRRQAAERNQRIPVDRDW